MPASCTRLTGAVALAVVASGLLLVPAVPASANPGGTALVITEVYGGGGNGGAAYRSDFIELYNPTNSAISLTGMSLQYRSEAGATVVGSSNKTDLTGSVPAHGYFLVKEADGAGTTLPALPDPDQVGTIALGGTGGQVFLSSETALLNPGSGNMIGVPGVVDMVGWGAATGGTYSFEGTAKAAGTANATSTSRNASNADTDSSSADFTTGTPTPTNSGPVAPTPLEATAPGAKTASVGQAITGFTLAATGGTAPYTWTATGTPPGVDIAANGAVSGTPTTVGSYTVTATVTDSAASPATDDVEFTFTIAEEAAVKSIAEIQGAGARSPFAPPTGNASGAESVTVEGVVTARYPAGGFNGMYIQTPGADTDGVSDGIFVYAGSANANIPTGIEVGDSVRVTGPIAEFYDLTQIVPASADAVTELGTSLGTITPRAIAYPTTAAGREAREGELLAPTDTFTVSNSYSTNQYAEVGLAVGTTPLKQMTEFVAPDDAAGIKAVKDENFARGVVLDDGSTVNYLQNQANKALPVPFLTKSDGTANAIRVGAEATLQAPVVLDWRNDVWKFQPQTQVTTNGADVVAFEDTRTTNLVPQNVGGDLKIATFNVLNYFNTTGEAYSAAGPLQNPALDTFCTYYTDRQSNRIGNNSCGVRLLDDPSTPTNEANSNDGRGPRGAATAASLQRQETKLTNTLLALDADIVGLEEVENSIKLPGETNRDEAVIRIVELLNQKAGAGTWAYVRSPGESLTASAVAEQDVIRPAFIYQTETVRPVGQSDVLFGTDQFANAREPLAQAFKAKGAPDDDAFAVIVNHFKSKGDNTDPVPPATGDNANDSDTGVGAFNGDRVRQAERLVQFADDFAADRGIDAVFLAGDFNSYTKEKPIEVLEDGGFELVESDQADDESYSYQGLSGSLDHVLGNEAAMDMVDGADIWEINANESAAFQYSRHNYNLTDFWQPSLPFATSDHNPEIIGIDVPDFTSTTYKEIQVLGTNDFHGRLLPDAGNAAGAAPFATAVKELEAENPNSVFVAAGDLVGASTFESFIQDDEPTIDALNAMGLEVSAAGNHEFDRGYADFVGRIQDRADWKYIAANVEEPEGQPDKLAETWIKTIDGVKVGFVGAVTEDLPALVNPAGIKGVTVTDVVDATNEAATELKSGADPADLVILLVHEGSPSTSCASDSFTDAATTWGNIVQNTSSDVDAIISGHTHLAYNCRFTVQDWADDGRAVTKRPVVSAGQYGTNLNQLVFKYDEATGDLAGISQDVVAAAGVGYALDPTVQGIVDDAVDFAETAGAAKLGSMSGPFKRASYLPGGKATENRGGESTLNNQVAEVQRWATDKAGIDTDLAFMNPGGLRADMVGTVNGSLQELTYRQAADVQPFANTLVNMKLTGAQIETVLEQQWQRNAQGGVPSRPFLRLGVSKGFSYTYVETPETVRVPNSAPVSTFKGEVTGMWLDGKAIEQDKTYSVTVNSFLGGGGDNFWELAEGADKIDSGKVDLEAMVDYMKQYDATKPLAVDYSQRGVEVAFPGSAPEEYAPGGTVAFDVASWSMSAAGDKVDTELDVKLGGAVIGTATLDNSVGAAAYDNTGTATVSVTLPESTADGARRLRLVGATTGTSIWVPIQVEDGDGTTDIQILATNDFHGRIQNDAASASAGAAVLAGAVKQLREQNPSTVFAAAGDLIGASTFESFILNDKPTIDALNEAGLEVSAVGNHELDKGYDDLVDRVMAAESGSNPDGGAEWQYIAANLKMKVTGDDAVPATWVKTMNGVDVGFVGAVTEELPALVSPGGIADLQVDPIVSSVNAATADLKAAGADVVVMLVHEGAPTTACAGMNTGNGAWASIVNGVSPDVDAIVSGHTHLEYSCSFPVAAWADRPVKERPVVSAGQYGMNLNQLVFSVDTATGDVVAKTQELLKLKSCANATTCTNYPADDATASVVAHAVTAAEPLGARVLGQLGGGLSRAKFANGVENRGGESTLGNTVAEVQRWATPDETVGAADIAFMNPGGLRQDMVGSPRPSYPRDLTYRQAANVQSFANTLVNMDLTGAQIKKVLEQQWQRTTGGTVPTRAFLRLGASAGFTYTYDEVPDPAIPTVTKGVVTGMWLHGDPIDLDESYSVTVNSFLATGGDNFRELGNGQNKQDTGKTDLQAMVEYMAEFGAGDDAIPVDYQQQAVRAHFPDAAPDSYNPGDDVDFDLSSLSMTGRVVAAGQEPGFTDPVDTQVQVKMGDVPLGTFPVTTEIGSAPDNNTTTTDSAGASSVSVTLPDEIEPGTVTLTAVGNNTGTVVRVPVQVEDAAVATVSAGDDVVVTWGQATSITVEVTGNDGVATGVVKLFEEETQIGSATDLVDGKASFGIAAKSMEPGAHTLRVAYSGNYPDASDAVVLTVAKATTTVSAADVSGTYGQPVVVVVVVGDASATGTVEVRNGATALGSAAVSGGTASVTLPSGSLEPGAAGLTAAYGGDGHFLPGTDAFTATIAKATSTVSANDVSLVYGKAATVTVDVGPSGATGTVQVLDGPKVVGSAAVSGGVAKVTLPARAIEPGSSTLTAAYSGDAHLAGGSGTFTATVAKATSSVKVTASPSKVKLKKTRATLRIVVTGPSGVAATGKVKVKVPGQGTKTATLRAGKATLRLAKFSSTGKKGIWISYQGSDLLKPSAGTVKVKVVR